MLWYLQKMEFPQYSILSMAMLWFLQLWKEYATPKCICFEENIRLGVKLVGKIPIIEEKQ